MKKLLRKLLPKLGLSLKSDLDWVYEQRDIAAMVAAKLAVNAYPEYDVSVYQDDREQGDDSWCTIVQISGLESGNALVGSLVGQISWHMGLKSSTVAKGFSYREKQSIGTELTCLKILMLLGV